jgi:hypothetical protein
MNDALIQAALAKFRRGDVPGDVAVAFDRETGDAGSDGRKWRFMATNGEKSVPIEAELTGSRGGGWGVAFSAALLEAAVERRINRRCYSRKWLMEELATDGSISLQKEDLRPHPPRDGSTFFS